MSRRTVEEIQAKKGQEKIVMLTAYDYPMAALLDECGVDIILVGDSLANVVLGLEYTKDVTMDEMLHHAKAVNRGVKQAMVIGDMPYGSYADAGLAVKNAQRFIHDAGCNAVKVEWFKDCNNVVKEMVKAGIPVMGHVGLTPQYAQELGGLKVQGKDAAAAADIIKHARLLEEAGCFSIVMECIPQEIACLITKSLTVPLIGIGAGVNCDGQVLVTYDLLGLFTRFHPKFVKQYADLSTVIKNAVGRFMEEVKEERFPDRSYSFSIDPDELDKLKEKAT